MRCRITVPVHDLETLTGGTDKEREKAIRQIFEGLKRGEHAKLLTDFCTEDMESYFGNVNVTGMDFDTDTSGLVDVNFTGTAYYGCKDQDRVDDHDEAVTFEISEEESTITFMTDPPVCVNRDAFEEI